jgi:hypothetical protein
MSAEAAGQLTPALASSGATAHVSIEAALRARLCGLEREELRRQFVRQGSFIAISQFLPPEITARLLAAVDDLKAQVHRNYVPGHKRGGSISRHTIDAQAAVIAELYRSASLFDWLSGLCGERLQASPQDDPHAYALYFYTEPGDHIGWHYDTSYYVGRRYTMLLGLVDRSTSFLEYELHTRDAGVATITGAVQIPPGGMVFFDGDRLRHRITPLGKDERRVSLTFEYVTDPRMHRGWRFVSNMKDAIAYFGFRQVFHRLVQKRAGRA